MASYRRTTLITNSSGGEIRLYPEAQPVTEMRVDCAKVIAILLNIVIFVGGACCVVAGVLLRFDSGFMGSEVLTMLNEIKYHGMPMGLALEVLAYMSLAFGGVMLILAVIGIVGAWQGSKGCLYCYLVSVVFMILIEVAIIGVWIAVRKKNNEWLRGQLLTLLTPYAGPTSEDDTSAGWNTLFMEAHCCGVTEVVYTGTSSDFTDLPTTWTSATDKVPASCCQGVSSGTVAGFVGSATCTTVPNNYYMTGCYETIKDSLDIYSVISITACAVMILAQVIVFVASCVLVASNQTPRHSNKTYPSRPMTPMTNAPMTPEYDNRPPPYVAIDKFFKNRHKRRGIDDEL